MWSHILRTSPALGLGCLLHLLSIPPVPCGQPHVCEWLGGAGGSTWGEIRDRSCFYAVLWVSRSSPCTARLRGPKAVSHLWVLVASSFGWRISPRMELVLPRFLPYVLPPRRAGLPPDGFSPTLFDFPPCLTQQQQSRHRLP